MSSRKIAAVDPIENFNEAPSVGVEQAEVVTLDTTVKATRTCKYRRVLCDVNHVDEAQVAAAEVTKHALLTERANATYPPGQQQGAVTLEQVQGVITDAIAPLAAKVRSHAALSTSVHLASCDCSVCADG